MLAIAKAVKEAVKYDDGDAWQERLRGRNNVHCLDSNGVVVKVEYSLSAAYSRNAAEVQDAHVMRGIRRRSEGANDWVWPTRSPSC